MSSFVCSTCGERHEGFPLSFAADHPDLYAELSEEEREARALCSSDQCIIDDNFFAVRGLIPIPIQGSEGRFLWGAWARVSAEDFRAIDDTWQQEGREHQIGPFKGRLVNKLSLETSALDLKLTVKVMPIGERPVFLIDEPHELTTAQQHGMTLHQAHELSMRLMQAFSET